MNDQSALGGHLAATAGKLAVSAGPTAYGLLTLNNIALVVGILSSVAVLAHTLQKMWYVHQDRKAGRAK